MSKAKNKKSKTPNANTTHGETLAAHFRVLDDVARGVVDGDNDLDNLHLDDDERQYVANKVAYIKRKRHNKKLAKEIEERQRKAEEADERKAKLHGVERVNLWKHPLYKLVATKYDAEVPVGRMFVAYERWLFCVSNNVIDRLIIAQLLYWYRPRKWASLAEPHPRPRARLVNAEGEPEVAKTDEEMSDEIGVTMRTIQNRRAVLIRRGIIKVRYKKYANKRTCHYTLDWDALLDAYWEGGGDTNNLKLAKPSNVVSEGDDDDDDEQPAAPVIDSRLKAKLAGCEDRYDEVTQSRIDIGDEDD